MIITQPIIDKIKADLVPLVADAAPIASLAPSVGAVVAQVNLLTPDPVPTGQQMDIVTIYDGPQNLVGSPPNGITKHFLYKGWLPWKHEGGDWVDAAGTPQGTVPFFTLNPKTGQTGVIQADISAVVKQDARMLLRGVGGETVTFAGRGMPGGPVVIYDTPTGSVTVPALADDECNPSTEYEQGDNPQWTVSVANGVYLSFPTPPAGWTKATLQLTIVKAWTGGVINGFQFQWGGLPPMPSPTDTLSLKGDPRVFFETADFTDIPPYLKAMLFGDPVHSMNLDPFKQREIVQIEDGSKVLQLSFVPQQFGCASAAIMFPGGDEVDEAAVEFEIRFLPSMLTGLRQGFKCFAGFSSATRPDDAYFSKIWGTQIGRAGTLPAGNGGAKSHGNDGWTLRYDSMMSPPPDHPMYGHFAPLQYAYWPEQVDFFGDGKLWNSAGFTPKVMEWHRMTSRAKINTCVGTDFKKDAEFDGFIDGVLAQRWRGGYLRTTDDPITMHAPVNTFEKNVYNVRSRLAIARVWINAYHGGTYLPLARCSYQIRNLRVAKFA